MTPGDSVTIRLPRVLADIAGVTRDHSVDVASVPAAIEALLSVEPSLAHHLVDESGTLRHHIRCAVNGTILLRTSDNRLTPGDVVTILHSVSGG